MNGSAPGWLSRAQAQMGRGDGPGAIDSLKHALGFDPENAVAEPAALLGSIVIGLFILGLDAKGLLVTPAHVQYALLLLTLWKIAFAYVVFMLQSRSIEIYAYYGGGLRNGIWVLAVSLYLRAEVLRLVDSTLWVVVTG